MERYSDAPHFVTVPPPTPVSTPLVDATIYRPGHYFALGLMALPVVVALAGALVTYDTGHDVPLWLPFALLLWIPCLPFALLTLKSVRTTATGVAVGRPFQRWMEVPWTRIERVEKQRSTMRIFSTDGMVLRFQPPLLREGLRLERQLLLRLPTSVLSGTLREQAQNLVMGDIFAMPEGGLSGMLRARPRAIHLLGAGAAAVLGVALAALAITHLPLGVGIPVGVVCGLGGLGALGVALWLVQEVRVDAEGVFVRYPLVRVSERMTWADVQLIERDPREVMLRLRGSRKLRCLGPNLLRRTQRDVMRAFLHEYCVGRGVPVVQRFWMW